MTDTTEKQAVPDDLADREFTAIGGAPAAGQQPGDDEQQEPQGLTNAQIFGGALAAGREVFCLVTKLESPKRVLTDERAKHVGDLWGPVFDKKEIDLAKYLGDYALEVAAVVGTLAVVMELRTAVTAEIIAKRPPKEEEAEPVHDGSTIEV